MKAYLSVKDVMEIMDCSRQKANEYMDVAEWTQVNGITWVETKEYMYLEPSLKNKRKVSALWFTTAFPSTKEVVNERKSKSKGIETFTK